MPAHTPGFIRLTDVQTERVDACEAGAAGMEPGDEIYINLEELSPPVGKGPDRPPEDTGAKAVRWDSAAVEETETWSLFKVASVCLGLLCFILLTSVIGVAVTYDRDFNQLLTRNQNLTDERNQLESSLRRAELDLDQMKKDSATCPGGWRKFGCSCYILSPSINTWERSRTWCSWQGADLVIINSREEMVFLNKLGVNLKFWIGFSQTSQTYQTLGQWTWTNGQPAGVTYWLTGHPRSSPGTRTCAAFNSFQTVGLFPESWSSKHCASYQQWVCEKEAVPSETLN